jgi:hypothetical protein
MEIVHRASPPSPCGLRRVAFALLITSLHRVRQFLSKAGLLAVARSAKARASCRIWAILSELAFHSVTPPNEEVANKIRTAFTRENMRFMPAEFNTILQLFFRI